MSKINKTLWFGIVILGFLLILNTSKVHAAITRLDPTFSDDGLVYYNGPANGTDYGINLKILDDGSVLVTGVSDQGSGSVMTIWKYLPDGSLDTTFANNGIFTGIVGPTMVYKYNS